MVRHDEYIDIFRIIYDTINEHMTGYEINSNGGCSSIQLKGSTNLIALEAANRIASFIDEGGLYEHKVYDIPIPDVVKKEIKVPDVILSHYSIGEVADFVSDRINMAIQSEIFKTMTGPTTTRPDCKPVKVWFNPPYTTVEFTDGDKVTVEQQNFEDTRFDEYTGYCCAVVKKMFGSTTNAFKVFEEAKKKAVEDSPKYKREMANKAKKARNKENRELSTLVHKMKVEERMDSIRIQKEAEKRLEEEEK